MSIVFILGVFSYNRAYQIYDASKLAPFYYLEVAFSYMFEIFVMKDTPDIFSITGTILIVSVSFFKAQKGKPKEIEEI